MLWQRLSSEKDLQKSRHSLVFLVSYGEMWWGMQETFYIHNKGWTDCCKEAWYGPAMKLQFLTVVRAKVVFYLQLSPCWQSQDAHICEASSYIRSKLTHREVLFPPVKRWWPFTPTLNAPSMKLDMSAMGSISVSVSDISMTTITVCRRALHQCCVGRANSSHSCEQLTTIKSCFQTAACSSMASQWHAMSVGFDPDLGRGDVCKKSQSVSCRYEVVHSSHAVLLSDASLPV